MRYAKRLMTPLLLLLAGASVPVALGAAQLGGDQPSHEFTLGRIGTHRLLENELIFDYRGELYVLRYNEYPVHEKLGMVSFRGDIIAAPLREELLRKQSLPPHASSNTEQPPRQAPDNAAVTAKR